MFKSDIRCIAVIGATGLLGKPVTQAASKDFIVKAISRNINKDKSLFHNTVLREVANIDNEQSLSSALKGCDAIHINLSGNTPETCYKNQVLGVRNIINVAKHLNIKRITYLSGTTTVPENTWHYDTKSKFDAEQIIINSGIPYIIFCPSWFMETLPLFIQGKSAIVFGPTTKKIHWLSADDYAEIVIESYKQSDFINGRLHLHGPEGMTFYQALERYIYAQSGSNIKLYRLPYILGHWMARLTKDKDLKDAIALLKYYETVGENKSLGKMNDVFYQPRETLNQWLKNNL